jgi:D-alanine-D-alanine ligase
VQFWSFAQNKKLQFSSLDSMVKKTMSHGENKKMLIEKVVILSSPISEDANVDEKDSAVQVIEVRDELLSFLGDISIIPFTLNLSEVLKNLEEAQPDLVFNLVESVDGHSRLIHLAPALLDTTGIPYSGAGTNATFLTSNKLLAKSNLIAAGIPTSRFFSLNDLKKAPSDVEGHYIIKSVWEHASIGLGQDSIVDIKNASELIEKMSMLQPRLSGECFAEAYIDGREFNLSMLAGPNGPQVLPPAEILYTEYYANQFKILDYEAKWKPDSIEYINTRRSFDFPQSDAALLEQLKSIALACWSTFDLHGYARVDFRVDQNGNPFVLEVNTNPCISKDAGFIAACERSQISYREVILRILADAKH